MESDSTNLRSIIEEEEEIEASTVGSDKKLWKQDLRSVEEMEDKENIRPENISDSLVSENKAPQSIRKKGFNLRKSLAWNPAFFTEEGVLEPGELSYISGSLGESNRSVKSGNRQIFNQAVENSYSKSQMKSELRGNSGRKLFATPEPSRRQEKKAPEGTRNLNPGRLLSKTSLQPPTTNPQKRVANMSATGHVPKVQKFMPGNTTSNSQVSSNQHNVPRVVKRENNNGPKGILLNQEKEQPLFRPKLSTGVENSAASQMNSQTIPKAPISAPLSIKPSALRKPSPSFGFFAQGNIAAQSGTTSQKSPVKTLTGIPSSLPKPPNSKWRPPIGHVTSTKLTTGTSSQSKIPRKNFERSMVNSTGKKRTEKSTQTSIEPREKKSASSHLSCNNISSETRSNNVVLAHDSSKKNQSKNSSRVFVEAKKEPPAAQHTSNSILIETCSIDENASKSYVNSNGIKHMEEENRVCGGEEETVVSPLTQNTISPETCSPMDVDMVIISNDVDLKVDTNCIKHKGNSNTICEGEKEEAVVTPFKCNPIPNEKCSSKDKHTIRNNSSVNCPVRRDIAKVSPLRTQRGKTDFSPSKEKLLEKRLKSNPGSSLTTEEEESFENEKPEVGKVVCGGEEDTVVSPLTQKTISPEKCSLMDVDMVISKSNDVDLKVDTNCTKHKGHSNTVCEGEKEEVVVTASTSNAIPNEKCLSKDKHTIRNNSTVNSPVQGDIAKVSPLRIQRGKTDFSPSKEKPLEKRFESNPGSSLTIKEEESFENEKPEVGKVVCGGEEETVVSPLTQKTISPETCSPMDVDMVISKSNDVDSKVDTNCIKHKGFSNTVCEGQKEEAVVTPSTCNPIPNEKCSSKDKHTIRNSSSVNSPVQGDIAKVSPLRIQRGKTDFSPSKEKPLEKRLKSNPGSSLTTKEEESFENEKPEVGKIEDKIAEESSERRIIPKFRKDLVPFSEEWLAALEASGEEILEKKTGPVQNSPPDKTVPEPSPWSPVKRKAQDIGPYDCTKYFKTSDAQ